MPAIECMTLIVNGINATNNQIDVSQWNGIYEYSYGQKLNKIDCVFFLLCYVCVCVYVYIKTKKIIKKNE